jgi:excinuclease UvrABC ATPase subunit
LVPDVISALLLARISLDRLGRYFSKPEVTALGQRTSSTGRIRLKQATVGWPSMHDAEEERINDTTEQADFRLHNLTVDIPQNALTLVSGPLGSGKTLFVSFYSP